MSIHIDQRLCRQCGKCVEACPGNLIKKDETGKAFLRRPRDCWGCVSCLKECAFGAISLYLGAEIGGMGSAMRVRSEGTLRHWIIARADGRETVITVNAQDANKY